MAKAIFTFLLAAQLFLGAAHCAAACCVPEATGSGLAKPSEVVSQTSQTEPAIESGHCHARHVSKPKPKKAADISASHHHCPNTKSFAAIGSGVCACAVEREEQTTSLLPAKRYEVSSFIRDLLSAESPPDWRAEASPPQTSSPHSLCTHSPPQTIARLNLRI